MRRAGHLFERVIAWDNLLEATHRAARGKRGRPDVARFVFRLEHELLTVQRQLVTGTWRPGPFRTFHIRDPKARKISAAPFRDRVVHHALMNVLDPVFDSCLIDQTFACRRGLGVHKAVACACRSARLHRFYLKGDVEACFESIDHAILKGLLRRKIKGIRVLRLLEQVIDASGNGKPRGRGLPIGSLTSQYLANLYLAQVDRLVKQRLRVRHYLRYMDDFVLFGDDKGRLHRHRAAIRTFLTEELRLTLKERATRVAPTSCGLRFLGFVIFPSRVRLQGGRLRRTRSAITRAEAKWRRGLLADEELACRVQASVAHIQHAATLGLRRRMFRMMNGER